MDFIIELVWSKQWREKMTNASMEKHVVFSRVRRQTKYGRLVYSNNNNNELYWVHTERRLMHWLEGIWIKFGRGDLPRLILFLICQIQHPRYMNISYKSIDFLTEDWSHVRRLHDIKHAKYFIQTQNLNWITNSCPHVLWSVLQQDWNLYFC
jgi:hypothetical protein